MKVGILIITHSDIGKQLLLTATSVFGRNPFRVEILSVDNYDQPNDVKELAEKYVNFLDNGNGVLVLTDIVGTTPSNIASSIDYKNIKIVAGLNLSMILNVFNYPNDSLDDLSVKAIEGGTDGISNVFMISKKILIVYMIVLHASASAKVVSLASNFESKINLIKGSKHADAKSIMKILMLSASKGSSVIIEVDGVDQNDAMQSIEQLFKNKFDEGS